MTTIHDVAHYITSKFDSPISTMKLQKLVYFAQGWNLAVVGRAMFPEDFLAWRNGPVARELWDHHRGQYFVDGWPHGHQDGISETDRLVLEAVVQNYGALSGQQLSKLSHEPHGPWDLARRTEGVRDGQRGRHVVSKDSMKTYFETDLGVDPR